MSSPPGQRVSGRLPWPSEVPQASPQPTAVPGEEQRKGNTWTFSVDKPRSLLGCVTSSSFVWAIFYKLQAFSINRGEHLLPIELQVDFKRDAPSAAFEHPGCQGTSKRLKLRGVNWGAQQAPILVCRTVRWRWWGSRVWDGKVAFKGRTVKRKRPYRGDCTPRQTLWRRRERWARRALGRDVPCLAPRLSVCLSFAERAHLWITNHRPGPATRFPGWSAPIRSWVDVVTFTLPPPELLSSQACNLLVRRPASPPPHLLTSSVWGHPCHLPSWDRLTRLPGPCSKQRPRPPPISSSWSKGILCCCCCFPAPCCPLAPGDGESSWEQISELSVRPSHDRDSAVPVAVWKLVMRLWC